MAKLYELSQNYKNLEELLDNPDIAEEVIKEALSELDEEWETKAENLAKLIKSLDVDVKGLKEEEQRLVARRKSLENRIAGLKTYLEDNMKVVGKDKIKGKVFTLYIQQNKPSLDIVDEFMIPEKYFVVKREVAKNELLNDLKQGIEVPGATIKQTASLRIR